MTSNNIMMNWKAKIQQSLLQNKSLPYAKYVQLATVQANGRPANRTVVFRGFLGDTEDLTFVSDRRTKKVDDVGINPAAEACWYFPTSREQYRLSGDLTIVGEDHLDEKLRSARQAAWANMSDSGRTQFSWPMPREARVQDPTAFTQAAPGPQDPALADFCLVVLRVHAVDYVQLFENSREVFHRDASTGVWQQTAVNP